MSRLRLPCAPLTLPKLFPTLPQPLPDLGPTSTQPLPEPLPKLLPKWSLGGIWVDSALPLPCLCPTSAQPLPAPCPTSAQPLPNLCPNSTQTLPKLCPTSAQPESLSLSLSLLLLPRPPCACAGHVSPPRHRPRICRQTRRRPAPLPALSGQTRRLRPRTCSPQVANTILDAHTRLVV